MSAVEAVAAAGGEAAVAPLALRLGAAAAGAPPAAGGDFGSVLMEGLRSVDSKIATADGLVRRFAVDDSVPLHQVTIALGEAKLAVELAAQVRTRLVEAYREVMNMPL